MKEIVTARVLPSIEMIREDQPTPETMAAINRWTRRQMTPDDVHVRRAFGIHDAVDTYYSRFPVESIETVGRKSPGAPVTRTHGFEIIGPSPEELARIFRAVRVHRPDVAQPGMVEGVGSRQWGAFDFYWMRGHSAAEDLALEIDGGIKREVSLGWNFRLPKCSICTKDMRECDHMPGKEYDGATAYYEICEVARVRHLAFVDRGGQLGTEVALLRGSADRSPTQVVDAYIKAIGVSVADEDREGLIEFARCYDGRKLAKKERAGWFDQLEKRGSRLSWFDRKG